MTLHEAVADAIRASGFDAMADEYLAKSGYRHRIISAMTRNIAREYGAIKSRQFNQLALAALRSGAEVA